MTKIKSIKLKNELNIVFSPTKGESFTLLILVNTGSKYENKRENGIAHFLEHMCFKGTKKRTSQEIAFELDKIGAVYNAFTSYEYTGYYAKARPEHFNKILEILSDIYLNSVFPEEEIEKERGVILEELKMYLDKPESLTNDIFMELIYGKEKPLGRSIIGSKENILRFKRKDFLNFKNKNYFLKNTVVAISGPFDFNFLIKNIKREFDNSLKIKDKTYFKKSLPVKKFKTKTVFKKIEQVHINIGFPLFSYFDKRKYDFEILNTILTKGMSSWLWKTLREKLGIVYTFSGDLDLFNESGIFLISAGLDKKRYLKGIKAIVKSLVNLKNGQWQEYEVEKAKEMVKSNLAYSLESTTQQVLFYGLEKLLYKEIKTPSQIFKIIDKIKAKDLKKVSSEFIDLEKIVLAVLGPTKKTINKRDLL